MSQKMEFYKIRDFGEKFNATVEFIRKHFLSLFVLILVVTVPFTVLGSIIQYFNFAEFQNFTLGLSDPFEIINLMGELLPLILLSVVVSLFLNASLYGSVYTYMRMTENSELEVKPIDVVSKLLPKIGGLVVLSIVSTIIVMIGSMFFFLPGIYLAVVLALAVPVYVFEDVSIGEALGKPFTLIRGKWWSTFGLLFVTIVLVIILAFAIAFPVGLVIGLKEIFSEGEFLSDESSQFWQVLSNSVINSLTYVFFSLPTIALAFQYFNLTERTEGRGLKSEIEGFEEIK